MKIDTLLVSAALFAGTADCFAPCSSGLGTFQRQMNFRNHEQAADATTAATAGRKRPRAHSTRAESTTPRAAASNPDAGRHTPSAPPPPPAGLPPRLQAAVDMLGQDTDLKTKSKLLVELGDAFAGTEAAALPQPPPAGEAVDEAAALRDASSAVALEDGWYARKVPGCVSEVHVAVRVDRRSTLRSPRGGVAGAADDSLGAGGGGGIVSIRGTADARLSRGLLALLALGLQGQSPRTVLGLRGRELAATVGMRAGLTDSRINGLGNVLGVIQDLVRAHFRRAAVTAAAAAGAAGSVESPPAAFVDLSGSPGGGKADAAVGKAPVPAASAVAAAAPPRPATVSQPLRAGAAAATVAAAARGDSAAVTTNAQSEGGRTAAGVAGLDPSRSWGDDASSWYPLPGAENEVAMLLSGGVDSSVAMRLLQDQGYKIRAFYLKIWLEDELAHLNECPWEEDLAYATAVCQQAGVPLEVVPLQKEYWDEVVSYTVREAREGRTPNPDVMCNSRVKFGMFYDHVGKHFRHVATGHYARLEHPDGASPDAEDGGGNASAAPAATALDVGSGGPGGGGGGGQGRVRLLLSPDAVKDQTYFLCALTQNQLRKALFPLGGYTKDKIRELAQSFDLPTKNRKDSQGICFLGKLKFDEFLQHYLGTSPGTIVDQSGRPIGKHRGLWFHTIGQRKGVGPGLSPGVVNLGPWYVADKDMEKNVLVVTNDPAAIAGPREVFRVEALQWISGELPAGLAKEGSMRLQVKTRHGPQMRDCLLRLAPPSTLAEGGNGPAAAGGVTGGPPDSKKVALAAMATQGYVKLDSKDSALAPGQFAAFYIGDECVGAGVIGGWSAAAAAAVGLEDDDGGAHPGSAADSKPVSRRRQRGTVLREQSAAAA